MKTSKPWGGRFRSSTSASTEAFTESISIDSRLFRHDILGSMAHAEMLAATGILTKREASSIVAGLKGILADIEAGRLTFRQELEDIHMNVEAALIERVGDVGRKLHTARSRNDQVALDMRLWVREAISQTEQLLRGLQAAFVRMGKRYADVCMPGFTHLQHAQPLSAGHYALAYVEMFQRDVERLEDCDKRVAVSPLGACAVSGTSLPIDPTFTAKELGFRRAFANSLDAVSDRDFCVEFMSCLAITAMHLSRLAEEWTLWCSAEFRFVIIDEKYCTGSSLMPQKRNPDVLELIRGKCARVYADMMQLLCLMKGLPLAYNRDMQEDKASLFDGTDTVGACLAMAREVVATARFNTERIEQACEEGYLDATSLAEYLVRKGVPFRTAHETAGRIVRDCEEEGRRLSETPIERLQRFAPVIEDDVRGVLGARNCLRAYQSRGSTAPRLVKNNLSRWEKKLRKNCSWED